MHAVSLLTAVRPVYRGTATVPAVNKAAATTPFGIYLELLMERTGYNTPAALARATGITDTTIGRWIKGEKLPTIPNLRAVAPVLKVRLGDMMVQAGLATAAELGQTVAPPPPLPPVVRDILTRLGPNSPLNERQKQRLIRMLEEDVDLFDDLFAEVAAIRASAQRGNR